MKGLNGLAQLKDVPDWRDRTALPKVANDQWLGGVADNGVMIRPEGDGCRRQSNIVG